MARKVNNPQKEQEVYAIAVVRLEDGSSLLSAGQGLSSERVESLAPAGERIQKAAQGLVELGFIALKEDELGTISISGSTEQFEKVFRLDLIEKGEQVEGSKQPDLISTENSELEDLIADISIAQRPELFASVFSPALAFWHLDVPGDVSLGMNADKVHRLDISGKDVKGPMVDTGFYQHPYFVARGYKTNPVVMAPDADKAPLWDDNGHCGFPRQHPDVISVGGAYLEQQGGVRASNYVSGFNSVLYVSREVPDEAGLLGERPLGMCTSLPVPPRSNMDMGLAGGSYPNRDTTQINDGWAALSGTSAAAPQVAGILALMKEANPCLKPWKAREILKQTARDVVGGNANQYTGAEKATPGHDLATGYGLADATAAATMAHLHYQKYCKKPAPMKCNCCVPSCNCRHFHGHYAVAPQNPIKHEYALQEVDHSPKKL